MSLGVLNNIAAIYAQNNLNQTQNSLQNTLQQLSSGSRINSGADDAAGLAVADGLHANEAALNQSASNASDGIGLLQTADGALSQVTNLLNRAVTLATEAANGTLNASQVSSANTEYQNILSEVGNIGANTNFNGNSVFSNNSTTLFVSDGTSSGANVYADTVGSLTTASVGQTLAAPTTTAATAPVYVAPVAAVANGAGVYTLTTGSGSDTLGGNLSFTVGSTGTQQNLTIAPGSTIAQIQAALAGNAAFSAAGLTATATSTSVLTITGGTSGANAAANAINFSGTALNDVGAAQTITPASGVTGVGGTYTSSTLTLGGGSSPAVANGDTVTGSLTFQFGTSSPFTVSGLSTTFNTSGLATVLNSNAAFTAAGLTATIAGTVLTVKGPQGSSTAITVTNGLTDTTAGGSPTYTVANNATTGAVGTAATETLTALSSATSTFSTGASITINSNTVTLAGLSGTAAAAAITANSTLAAAGISAAYNTTTKVLTITGNANTGAALTVSGTGLTANSNTSVTNLVTATAAVGSAATGGTETITLASANDTVSGNIALVVGTSGLAKDNLALTIAPKTTGQALVNQINQNKAFQLAGVTAAYNAANFSVTLTGPAGVANALVSTGTVLTDTSSAAPQAGVDFTNASISTLTGGTTGTAQQVLTSVTSAIADVAYQRGILGANINQLTAASGVASSESVNLTAAESSIRSTNYGSATSDLAKYKVLSETGISALAQANSVQQEVTKLLQ